MPSDIFAALQITAIGMSLVFAAILLLWGVMAALVRLTAEKEAPADVAEPDAIPVPLTADSGALKRQAAAVAVAVAVALAHAEATPPPPTPREFPLPPTAIVSAWQAVMRSRQLKQRGPIR